MKIVIHVEGGCVQDVYTDAEDVVDVEIIDLDDFDDEEEHDAAEVQLDVAISTMRSIL